MNQTAEEVSRHGRESDPGYYLIAEGRRAFEKELGCRVPFRTRFFRLNSDLGVMSYVGMIAVVTAIILALVLFAVSSIGVTGLAAAGVWRSSDSFRLRMSRSRS